MPPKNNEEIRAGLAKLRGHLAAQITDPDARQRFIAQQGDEEANGEYNGNIDQGTNDVLYNTLFSSYAPMNHTGVEINQQSPEGLAALQNLKSQK